MNQVRRQPVRRAGEVVRDPAHPKADQQLGAIGQGGDDVTIAASPSIEVDLGDRWGIVDVASLDQASEAMPQDDRSALAAPLPHAASVRPSGEWILS